jgi:hypothetical protein
MGMQIEFGVHHMFVGSWGGWLRHFGVGRNEEKQSENGAFDA